VTVIHDALLVAVHVHPAPAVTDTLAVTGAAPKVTRVGVIENVHGPLAF
jgi:hypothetical protein